MYLYFIVCMFIVCLCCFVGEFHTLPIETSIIHCQKVELRTVTCAQDNGDSWPGLEYATDSALNYDVVQL